MLLLLTQLALAGWTETARENGCVFFLGDRVGSFAPVRAECDWPIPAEKLQKLLAYNPGHADYFSSVATAKVLGPAPGGGELVLQTHTASGISDREAVLLMKAEPIPAGTRYSWSKYSDQSKVSGQNVPLITDTGKWEVTSTASGSHVVYELLYDPGGSVPGFLVRWFQGSGTRTLVGELRTWAESH
jgi:hypothetical protein